MLSLDAIERIREVIAKEVASEVDARLRNDPSVHVDMAQYFAANPATMNAVLKTLGLPYRLTPLPVESVTTEGGCHDMK